MKFSRREAIAYLSNLMGAAGVYPLLSSAHAQESASNKDEHFFIFVELKGGVHHTITTDYPDINDINTLLDGDNKAAIMTFPLGRQLFENDPEYSSFLDVKQVGSERQEAFRNIATNATDDDDNITRSEMDTTNGYFCALPYEKDKKDSYYYSGANGARLGPAALFYYRSRRDKD